MKKLFCVFLSLILCAGTLFAQEAASSPSNDVVQAVKDVVSVLQKYGLPFDAREACDAAVDAVIQVADPQGRLMSDADIAQMTEENKGILHEVGIRVVLTNKIFVISEVKKDSSAENSGLKAGEVLQEIDKGNIAGLLPSEVGELLRGPADQTVLLKIQDTNSSVREIEVKRDPVEAGAIQIAEELPANLCYLKLNGVFERSGKDIVSALRGWAETGRAGVVLDLRGAGGADAQGVADTASLFAESGALLFTFRDAQDQDIGVGAYKSSSSLLLNMPAMILIDEETRGSSELLAAALAGSTRGVMLIGSVSSGDPMVREVQDLPDGSHLYLATRRLVVADGRIYNGSEGVKPDLVVAPMAVPASEYEPEPATEGQKELSSEEKEDQLLRERVRGDETLRRAVDVLLGLKALNIRGVERAENPTN
jgi:carboxyl-terminal processing protease